MHIKIGGAAGVAAVGSLSGGLTYGTGYDEARSIIEGRAHLPWTYAPARAFATLLSYLSGIPAGLLAPSLSVGAGFGQFIADILGETSTVSFVSWYVWVLSGCHSSPADILHHRDGNDRAACNGLAAHVDGSTRNGGIETNVTSPVSVSRRRICTPVDSSYMTQTDQ
jgi:hypothetical protein